MPVIPGLHRTAPCNQHAELEIVYHAAAVLRIEMRPEIYFSLLQILAPIHWNGYGLSKAPRIRISLSGDDKLLR